jgi:ABC-2 type transport system permease protein
MAGITLSPETRGQFAAIARVRWQLTVNSLRTMRGRLEMVSRVLIGLGMTMGGFGAGAALGAAAWYFVSHAEVELIAILLWGLFLFWQLFPVMATAFMQSTDTSNLLRFPLSYRSFFLIQMVYGSLDMPTVLCCLWLVCMTIGVGIAAPGLFWWAALLFFAFALMNILLARMVFAWVERWLAKRRSREIMGILFFLFIISFQLINPLIGRFASHAHPDAGRTFARMLPIERALPAGLVASALTSASASESGIAMGKFALLCVYGATILWLLDFRVRKQYLGENLSEGSARVVGPKVKLAVREGWDLPRVPGPMAAIFEKELRYLMRSGPLLFTLVMPVVILAIFRFALTGAGKRENFMVHLPQFAFPVGVAYVLMLMINLIYNSFGADAAGVQFFFASPVRFREILMAKNLAHGAVIALEVFCVWIAASLLFGAPSFGVWCATIAGVLYGAPLNLGVGDLLSLYSPKKIDFGTLGRQRAAGLTAFASLGVQIVVIGIAALTVVASRLVGSIWFAVGMFLVFAAIAWGGYYLVLQRVDGIALGRRENLISELSRA